MSQAVLRSNRALAAHARAFGRWAMNLRVAIMRDPRRIVRLPAEIFRYKRQLAAYRRMLGARGKLEIIESDPILFQHTAAASPFDAHYVYQAAWATNRIVALGPSRHIDISSNIAFVAQLSAVVPVQFLEFNPPDIRLPGLQVTKGNVTALPFADGSLKSISCLHVLEHIGLGRYGDELDPQGTRQGCKELQRCCAPGGSLFISLPVGAPRTMFNAHRIHAPASIAGYFNELTLEEFSVVTDDGTFVEHTRPELYASMNYACGMYMFKRKDV